MHTGQPGFKHRQNRPELRVEYIHMGALLGFVVNVVIDAVLKMDDVPNEGKSAVLKALNKVIWIQNDLMAKWYIPQGTEGETNGVANGVANGVTKEEVKQESAGLLGNIKKALW
jgi:hypothetical protein